MEEVQQLAELEETKESRKIVSRFWNNGNSDDDDGESDGNESTTACDGSSEDFSFGEEDINKSFHRIEQNQDGSGDSDGDEEMRRSQDPDYAWEQIRDEQIFLEPPTKWIPSQNASTSTSDIRVRQAIVEDLKQKEQDSFVRFVFVSDTHANHRDLAHLPRGDVLVHAGDFSKTGETGSIEDLALYFHENKQQNENHQTSMIQEIICVAGNHDLTLDQDYYHRNWSKFHRKAFDTTVAEKAIRRHSIYLRDEGCDVVVKQKEEEDGTAPIHIWGSPYSPEFFDWAFNKDRGPSIRKIWDQIPSPHHPSTSTVTPCTVSFDDNGGIGGEHDSAVGHESEPASSSDSMQQQRQHQAQPISKQVDVLITHGPPLGRGDLVFLDETESKTTRAGCYDLLRVVQGRVKPRVHVFGHIHEGYGVTFDGTTMYINASSTSQDYEVINPPIVVDVRVPDAITKGKSMNYERNSKCASISQSNNKPPSAWVVRPKSLFRNGKTNICSVEQLIDWCLCNQHEFIANELRSKFVTVKIDNSTNEEMSSSSSICRSNTCNYDDTLQSRRKRLDCLIASNGRGSNAGHEDAISITAEQVFELLAGVLGYHFGFRGIRDARRKLAKMVLHLYAESFESER